MPAVVLFIGRVLLVVLLFVFLFAIMKTGVGLVKGQRSDAAVWSVDIIDGPNEVKGEHVDIPGPSWWGRSPGADIVLPGAYVSGRHARFSPQGPALVAGGPQLHERHAGKRARHRGAQRSCTTAT